MTSMKYFFSVLMEILSVPVTVMGFTFTPLQMMTALFFFGLVFLAIRKIFE